MKRKANQDATLHAMYATYLQRWNTGVNVPALVLSVILLAVVFVDGSRAETLLGLSLPAYTLLAGLLSVLNFAMVILLLYFRPEEGARRHRSAVAHFTTVKQEAQRLIEDPTSTMADVQALRKLHAGNTDVPGIPERKFNRYKRRHLQKVDVSVALSRNPHRSLRSIRRDLEKDGRPKRESTATPCLHSQSSPEA